MGLAFSYHEQVTKDFERLTDEVWNNRLNGTGKAPEEAPWLRDLIAARAAA